MLTDEEKWEAVIQRNPDYDRLFFYATKSTMIFCRPSCKSKGPLDRNAVFFDTVQQAIENGFRPCKRCRPDLLDYKPEKELALRIKETIDLFYTNQEQLTLELNNLGVCRNHVIRIFKAEYDTTPLAYANSLRVEQIQTLLKTTNRSILDIAYSCGFGSLSSFYKCFKEQTGLSPISFRKKQEESDNDN